MEILLKSGERALGGMINKIKRAGDIGANTFKKLFDMCVLPVMDYSGGIWGIHPKQQKSLKKLDRVQQHAQQFYLGIDRRLPIAGYEGDFPMMKGTERRIIEGFRFYNSLLKLPSDRLVVKIFRASKEVGKGVWTNSIKFWLEHLEIGEIWVNQSEVDLTMVREKLWRLAEQNWSNEVGKKPKLRTYRLFKTKLETSNHVTSCLPKYQRSLIQRLRLGTLPIQLELGRFTRTQVHERICKVCDLKEVEDEYHLLFKCDGLRDIRDRWMSKLDFTPGQQSAGEDLKSVFQRPYWLGNYLKELMLERGKLLTAMT